MIPFYQGWINWTYYLTFPDPFQHNPITLSLATTILFCSVPVEISDRLRNEVYKTKCIYSKLVDLGRCKNENGSYRLILKLFSFIKLKKCSLVLLLFMKLQSTSVFDFWALCLMCEVNKKSCKKFHHLEPTPTEKCSIVYHSFYYLNISWRHISSSLFHTLATIYLFIYFTSFHFCVSVSVWVSSMSTYYSCIFIFNLYCSFSPIVRFTVW